MIEKIASRFKTLDGKEHPTWNAARKHQTGLDLAETIRSAAPDLSESKVTALVKAIFSTWHISRKGARTSGRTVAPLEDGDMHSTPATYEPSRDD